MHILNEIKVEVEAGLSKSDVSRGCVSHGHVQEVACVIS